MHMLVFQLCPTLCNLMDCSPPGFSEHGILQARIMEWVAILFSRVSSQPRDWTQVSSIVGKFFPFWATKEAHISIAISLSIHPFTDTCFHILATVNNAAVKLTVQIYFSEILLCFNMSRHIFWITWNFFWEILYYFPLWLCHFTFLPTVHQRFPFYRFSQHLSLILISILISVRWCLIVVLRCIFLMTSDVEQVSSLCWPFVCLLRKMFIQILSPF